MQTFTDEQLIALAAKNDKEALEVLVARYLKLVYSFVYRYAKNAADAEDLTQEVFVKVWRHLGRFDEHKTFRPWLYKIAKNTALDFLKKKSPMSFSEVESAAGMEWLAQSVADESPRPETLTERSLLAGKFAAAVKKLAPEYEEMIVLRHTQDLNFRQIAKIKRQPLNTVKSRYRRALLLLKKIIGT
jgi:RNA polymerase sigma-70 factor (ECF subfamily)